MENQTPHSDESLEAIRWLSTLAKEIRQTLAEVSITDGPATEAFAIHPKDALRLASSLEILIGASRKH